MIKTDQLEAPFCSSSEAEFHFKLLALAALPNLMV